MNTIENSTKLVNFLGFETLVNPQYQTSKNETFHELILILERSPMYFVADICSAPHFGVVCWVWIM